VETDRTAQHKKEFGLIPDGKSKQYLNRLQIQTNSLLTTFLAHSKLRYSGHTTVSDHPNQ